MLDQQFEKNIDSEGAGATWTSPGWLTQLGRLWGGESVCAHLPSELSSVECPLLI